MITEIIVLDLVIWGENGAEDVNRCTQGWSAIDQDEMGTSFRSADPNKIQELPNESSQNGIGVLDWGANQNVDEFLEGF